MINILVLEDDEKLNYVMCTKLNSNSYNAIGCRNAMEALDKIQNVKFNLIISDIMMPQIDGFEFVSLIRR
ncbi:response regulator transcription factor, partial [Oenococcus oeni]